MRIKLRKIDQLTLNATTGADPSTPCNFQTYQLDSLADYVNLWKPLFDFTRLDYVTVCFNFNNNVNFNVNPGITMVTKIDRDGHPLLGAPTVNSLMSASGIRFHNPDRPGKNIVTLKFRPCMLTTVYNAGATNSYMPITQKRWLDTDSGGRAIHYSLYWGFYTADGTALPNDIHYTVTTTYHISLRGQQS